MIFSLFKGNHETAYQHLYGITGIIFCVTFTIAILFAVCYKRERFYIGSLFLLFLGNLFAALTLLPSHEEAEAPLIIFKEGKFTATGRYT
jgi:Na+/melibiose symporter-like transporter